MGCPFVIKNITETVIRTASGETCTLAGDCLDIGILDTMKHLPANSVGAAVFSIIGHTVMKSDRCTVITDKMIRRPVSWQEQKEEEILKRQAMLQERGRRKRKQRQKDKSLRREQAGFPNGMTACCFYPGMKAKT